LRVELAGDPPPTADKLDEIRRLLGEVDPELRLR
jgi:hypothetical protein